MLNCALNAEKCQQAYSVTICGVAGDVSQSQSDRENVEKKTEDGFCGGNITDSAYFDSFSRSFFLLEL